MKQTSLSEVCSMCRPDWIWLKFCLHDMRNPIFQGSICLGPTFLGPNYRSDIFQGPDMPWPIKRQEPNFPRIYSWCVSVVLKDPGCKKDTCLMVTIGSDDNKGRYQRKKRDYVGKIPKLRVGLTQTHFLMSTYQVIFGMPK